MMTVIIIIIIIKTISGKVFINTFACVHLHKTSMFHLSTNGIHLFAITLLPFKKINIIMSV